MPPRPEPLFWVVRDHDGKRTIFLQHASDKLFAWLRSAIAGHEGAPVEIHELDEATASKIPRKLIGRVLSEAEARALLARLVEV